MTQQNNKQIIGTSRSSKLQRSGKLAKSVLLEPAGYPLRLATEDTGIHDKITTDDPKLFTKYALAQWQGVIVKKGDFLFDSMIFPDFAFRVVKVFPNSGEITEKTKIKLQQLKKNQKKGKLPYIKAITLDDLIGQRHAKQKANIILKFLRDPKLLQSQWAPRNILFYGPPGTGKTMLAKALAHKADIPMISIKATELIGIFVGEGSKKVQNLFAEARKISPCIIFIDELDAVALKRNYQQIRGDVIEIVSALLGEMDGLKENKGIITLAATNIADEIDPAVLNRFEETIEFKLPNLEERIQIFHKNAKTSPIPFDVNWKLIAQKSKDLSGRVLVQQILKVAIHGAMLNDLAVISNVEVLEIIGRIQNEKHISHYA